MPTVTIEPNEKYRFVVGGEIPGDGDEEADTDCSCGRHDACEQCGGEKADGHEHEPEAEAYDEWLEQDYEPPEGEIRNTPVSWRDFSVSSDPDLLSKIATYFDGVGPDDPADLIRAKVRLARCEQYANAQIAAQAELREN